MESFILLPIVTMSGAPVGQSIGPLAQATLNVVSTPQTVLSQKLNIVDNFFAFYNGEDELAEAEAEAKALKAQKAKKAKSIDAYFEAYDMPLAGTGMKMVEEAEKNDIDWRLLPAIAVRESTGGKHACKRATYNSFGWGSCKINFKSNEAAIETVARNLGGNNPNTDHHYAGKTTLQILQKYNPPSIVKHYAQQVMAIMDVIGKVDEITTSSVTA